MITRLELGAVPKITLDFFYIIRYFSPRMKLNLQQRLAKYKAETEARLADRLESEANNVTMIREAWLRRLARQYGSKKRRTEKAMQKLSIFQNNS